MYAFSYNIPNSLEGFHFLPLNPERTALLSFSKIKIGAFQQLLIQNTRLGQHSERTVAIAPRYLLGSSPLSSLRNAVHDQIDFLDASLKTCKFPFGQLPVMAL
ncbi:Protein eva-1 [Trichinella pseudospiralis]